MTSTEIDTRTSRDPYWALRIDSPLSEEEKQFLRSVLPVERVRGKFVRGKLMPRSPGRPTGTLQKVKGVYNFTKLVRDYVERAGGCMEDVVAMLFEDLMDSSAAGDTAATKLLLERICGKEAEQLDVNVGLAQLNDVERAARLSAIFAAAAKRRITVEPAPPAIEDS